MTRFVFALALVLFGTLSPRLAFANAPFPTGPHPSMTVGSLCPRADQVRYPERIAYCIRNVHSETKRMIIRMYDERLGFRISGMDRQDFKIDHYIPLCAGGSNEINNLWPQHKSIYAITDPMEPLICEKMAQGKLRQQDAIRMIMTGKNDLSKVPDIIRALMAL